jgi:hypothetical protein
MKMMLVGQTSDSLVKLGGSGGDTFLPSKVAQPSAIARLHSLGGVQAMLEKRRGCEAKNASLDPSQLNWRAPRAS